MRRPARSILINKSAEDLFQYLRAPSHILKAGRVLEVPLFLYLPLNGSIIPYRPAGVSLSEEEFASLLKLSRENILILRVDMPKVLRSTASRLAQCMREGRSHEEVAEGAASMLRGIAASTAPGQALSARQARRMLDDATTLVEELLTQFKDAPSLSAYERALAKLKQSNDPFVAHNQQVSALSVLILLTIERGNPRMGEVSDLAIAGLMHDIGLAGIRKDLAEKHVWGHVWGSDHGIAGAEIADYMSHIQVSLELAEKGRIVLAPGASLAIQLHHENWDGSGFKGLAGAEIPKLARILHIADDVVGLLNNYSDLAYGFGEVVAFLAKKTGKSGRALYEPAVMQMLLAL